MRRPYRRTGWPAIAGLGLVVVAFMVLSLLVTATGTARFAVAMSYDARVGYVVGAIFDFAKGLLPVALLALLAQRALGTAILLGLPKPSLSARKPSLSGLASGAGRLRRAGTRPAREGPSNILPRRPRSPSSGLTGEDAPMTTLPSHVSDFVQQRLKRETGMSLGAAELRNVYEAWCQLRGYAPLTELKRLGFLKWKSSGLMRYRDLQLVA